MLLQEFSTDGKQMLVENIQLFIRVTISDSATRNSSRKSFIWT